MDSEELKNMFSKVTLRRNSKPFYEGILTRGKQDLLTVRKCTGQCQGAGNLHIRQVKKMFSIVYFKEITKHTFMHETLKFLIFLYLCSQRILRLKLS